MLIRFDGDEEVVHLQTHTSHVFLRGEEVYKVKKPVEFSFLDYGTPERRKECCEKEVLLNRRFSPEVYLGVVPLARHPDGGLALEGEGETLEWAVHMRRLPQEAMLARRLAAGDVRPDEMEALADLLADFYARAETSPEIASFGGVEQVRENTEENFETTLDFGEDLLPDVTRQLLRAANRSYLSTRAETFEGRIRAGRVLDGHGDLKPENIFLTGEGPVVTDCIEFNERFRYGDALVDLAYLTMGLLAAGRPDLRESFLARYRESGEADFPEDLLAYYETYRAVVKGKIEGYRARQPEVPEEEREEARKIARTHFRLAKDIALGFRPVNAIVVGEVDRGGIADRLRDGLGSSVAGLPSGDPIEVVVAVGPVEAAPGADVVLRVESGGDAADLEPRIALALGEALAGHAFAA
ncbi:MAG: phosphotransferase [Planctomycetota bacterium]